MPPSGCDAKPSFSVSSRTTTTLISKGVCGETFITEVYRRPFCDCSEGLLPFSSAREVLASKALLSPDHHTPAPQLYQRSRQRHPPLMHTKATASQPLPLLPYSRFCTRLQDGPSGTAWCSHWSKPAWSAAAQGGRTTRNTRRAFCCLSLLSQPTSPVRPTGPNSERQ
jgi:hypothetical protein